MPKYNPGPDDMGEMDESYAGDEMTGSPESVDEEIESAHTTIVPNKILSPEGEALKAGDEIVVRVVKNYGDESEIEYAPKKGAEESEEYEEPESAEAGELAALSEKGM